jgi:hypothetical protein
MLSWWRKWLPERSPPEPGVPALTAAEVARLAALGIHPGELTGRLRLVLPVGCARDFTQTRAILRTGSARDQVDAAIQALIARGAHCDCEVFQALNEPPRCLLWHQRPRPQGGPV